MLRGCRKKKKKKRKEKKRKKSSMFKILKDSKLKHDLLSFCISFSFYSLSSLLIFYLFVLSFFIYLIFDILYLLSDTNWF
jgi:hypothetical protein